MSRLINLVYPQVSRHWKPRYFLDRLLLIIYEERHPDYPWLTQQANTLLQSWLKKTHLGLEWGSGRSTIWLAKHIAHLTSVEHDPIWYEKVKKDCANANIKNTEIYCYPTSLKDEETENSPYVKIVEDFPADSLDFALVDGIFRSECALRVLKKLKPGGLLVIDNVNWYLPSNSIAPNSRTEQTGPSSQRWQALAVLLKDYRCIWTSNGVTDTAIWIKPCFQNSHLLGCLRNEN